jgi:hypothetical protein
LLLRVCQNGHVRLILSLFWLLLMSACSRLPEGQGDGGVTQSETEQLNQAAAALDAQTKTPRIVPGDVQTPKPPPLK